MNCGGSRATGASRIRAGTNVLPGSRGARLSGFCRWTLAVLACLWLAWCCAIGPLYWYNVGLDGFGWANMLILALSFAVFFAIVVALVRFGRGQRVLPRYFTRRHERLHEEVEGTPTTILGIVLKHVHDAAHSRPGRAVHAVVIWVGRKLTRCTDCWWKLMLVFVIGWLWIPTTLLAAYGADIRSQIREFSWAWNQWTGLKQPYIGFFSFVPMDIYPTAHYMWPANPTYLTDQHNIVLTVFYGAVAAISRYFTDSNDAGIVTLAAVQGLGGGPSADLVSGCSPPSAARPPRTVFSTCLGADLASVPSIFPIRNVMTVGISVISCIRKPVWSRAPPVCAPVRRRVS